MTESRNKEGPRRPLGVVMAPRKWHSLRGYGIGGDLEKDFKRTHQDKSDEERKTTSAEKKSPRGRQPLP